MKKYKFSLVCATCLVTLTSVSWGSGQGGNIPTGFFDRIGSIFGGNNQGQNPPQIPQIQILRQNPHEANNQPQNLTQIYCEESSDEENQGRLNSQANGDQIHCEKSSDEESEACLLEVKKRRDQRPQNKENQNQDSDEDILVACSQRNFSQGSGGSRQSRSGSEEFYTTAYGDFLVWRDQNNPAGVLTGQRQTPSQNSFEKKKEEEEPKTQEEALTQQQALLSQPPSEKKNGENQGEERIQSPQKKKVEKQEESLQQEFNTFLLQIYPQLFPQQEISANGQKPHTELTPQQKIRLAIEAAQQKRQKQGGLTIQRKKKKK